MVILPAKRLTGRLEMPGDKSISHRAALIAALASGTSRIQNFSTSDDCAATLRCLQQLGVPITRTKNETVVHGVGTRGLQAPAEPLDCANSGTTMRLLAGVLAGQNFAATLTGDESLRSRPMKRIIEPLEVMGAQISAAEGRAPLTIRGRQPLKPTDYELSIASAQIKSAILLAGLNAEGRTKVLETTPTRDHTERMLRWFGASVETGPAETEGQTFAAVTGPANFNARDVEIPGDISSAAYFIVAAGLLQDSTIEIANVGLNPSRAEFLKVCERLGFPISIQDQRERDFEPCGTVRVGSRQTGTNPRADLFSLNGHAVAALIDELPLLAILGSQIEGGIELRDARELRLKESDRIAATVAGLRAMGAEVEEFDDGLRVTGPARLRGARIDSRGDHRIAMTFAIAGLLATGETEIVGAECVNVSFPGFFELLGSVVEEKS